MPVVVVLCAGFLLAVLWMDLMFDVQVLRFRAGDIPEPVLSSIAAYYRRVTTDAHPMSNAIALAMLVAVCALVAQCAVGMRALAWLALPFCVGAVGLALLRVVPNAVRLGSRRDSLTEQSALARGICRDHVVCLACMLFVAVLQMCAALL